ncbi:MAG: polynucleotide kinase-phosphatase [Sandaracinaceae bacterium]|nr:polynucleotide kinase-phosphatase [Sandaracinaceae bacterium]
MSSLAIPALSVVVLVGPSGSGKSTLARRLFLPSEILSSDALRAMVRNDEGDMSATNDAFEALHFLLRKRLAAGLLTVIDATNVRPEDRASLVSIAKEFHAYPVAVVLDVGVDACLRHNADRPERPHSRGYVLRQHASLRRSVGRSDKALAREGFRRVFVLSSEEEIAAATLERTKLHADRREDHGPFDLIGDVHGCLDELTALLARLGYAPSDGVWRHPSRKAVFLGDLVDRGPASIACLTLAKAMVEAGSALMVPGNHEAKLVRALRGAHVKASHGLERTLAELEALAPEERARTSATLADFVDGLASHLVLDRGRLVAAHAGMKREMQMRASGAVREFALYGETTGEVDEFGLPVRADWARGYRGQATVVYGHTPVLEAEWLNDTICLDTGCVFGGKLTALRWPERELVEVPAARTFYEPRRPLAPRESPGSLSAQHDDDALLDLGELVGKRIVTTTLGPSVTIEAAHVGAALEVLSRFAVSPRWLVHLPPTMSPVESAREGTLLERPEEAFGYFRASLPEGRQRVVCEEKHMGSRAIVIVCRDEAVARARFGVIDDGRGVVYTRTGRRFFADRAVEQGLVSIVVDAAERAGLFEALGTGWLALDTELMPWSAKARELIERQYAAVGHAGTRMLDDASRLLASARARGLDVRALETRTLERRAGVGALIDAYRRYSWPIATLTDHRLAPFHLLASEGHVHVDRDHLWHMQTLAQLAAHDASGVLVATSHRVVDLSRDDDATEASAWWQELVGRGGEGMVVKPLDYAPRGPRGLVQPALKVRGPSYLKLIYGPDYDRPEHLARLRERAVGKKRALATRELALGLEALERFVKKQPLRRVHECVLGVLALESDPVDPRL